MSYKNSPSLTFFTAEIETVTGLSTTYTLGGTIGPARFVPLTVTMEPVVITALTAVPSISIGSNLFVPTDILSSTAMTGATTVNEIIQVPVNSLCKSVAPGSSLYVRNSTIANATSYIVRVTLIGYYYY